MVIKSRNHDFFLEIHNKVRLGYYNLEIFFRILEHDACEKLAREIMEQLTSRDREERSSKIYDALSGKIRIRLKQYSTEVKQLNEKLNLGSIVSSLYPFNFKLKTTVN